MKKTVLSTLILVAVVTFGWVLINKFEGTPPKVEVTLPSVYLKKSYELSLDVQDPKTGLKKVSVSIMQGGKDKVLLEKDYRTSGIASLFLDPEKRRDAFVIPIESWKYGMTDGEALIRVMVSDHSWRGWGKGNIHYAEHKVIIDTKAPKISVLTKSHNIERGGTGLVIYRLFEEDIQSGVRVGDNYFPGHSGMFDDKMLYAAFFALSHEQGPGTQISVTAEDPAGNKTQRGFYHYIRDKKFRTDTLNISEGFLQSKIPDFHIEAEDARFSQSRNALLDKFLYINKDVRKANVDKLLSIPSNTDNKVHWEGSFKRMRGSARRADFADRRIYKYKGKEIDRATHLGIDLASTSNAVVKSANSGKVIFADFEGIFGNTVIIDHGFGLCSLYAHLSRISVSAGDLVSKGQDIGTTGLTGLAGGDHLHFSMIVHNVFVNPVEWWDQNWIKNNITSKIEEVKLAPNG